MIVLEKWSPVTDDFALVNVQVDEAVAAYGAWLTRLGRTFKRTKIEDGEDSAFGSLAPLSIDMSRKLFVSAGPDWTAFFQSGIHGSDPAAGGRQLATELDTVGIRICVTPPDQLWQATMWEVYAPPRLGGDEFGYRRALAVANDGGRWVFESFGQPYDFEQLDRYSAARKRDRFDRQLLQSYLRECAVDPFEQGVLRVSGDWPAVMIEVASQGSPAQQFSYAEAARLKRK